MTRHLLTALFLVACFLCVRLWAENPMPTRTPLTDYIVARQAERDRIPDERKLDLLALSDYVGQQQKLGEPIRLNFICTHNSRRSQIAQIWAAIGAHQAGVSGIEMFSGGTESTTMNPRVVAALTRAGVRVINTSQADAVNPKYLVRFAADAPPLTCFSKIYDESPNPSKDFCAVMVCSDADAHCPIVHGASKRFAITYSDPKVADDKPEETGVYDERCAQIAREMLFIFSSL